MVKYILDTDLKGENYKTKFFPSDYLDGEKTEMVI
jgi:hypothetical protein